MDKKTKIEGVLWDMDGVLAEVSQSYRASIIKTCAYYGVTINGDDIVKAKIAGDANNDWVLTRNIIIENKKQSPPSLEEVTHTFENFYQGNERIYMT